MVNQPINFFTSIDELRPLRAVFSFASGWDLGGGREGGGLDPEGGYKDTGYRDTGVTVTITCIQGYRIPRYRGNCDHHLYTRIQDTEIQG